MTLILVRSHQWLTFWQGDIRALLYVGHCVVIFIPVMRNQCVSTQLGVQETFQPINMSFQLKLSVIGIDLCIITFYIAWLNRSGLRLCVIVYNRHTHLPLGRQTSRQTNRQTGGQAVHMLLLMIGIYSILPGSRSNLWAVSVQPSVYVCAFALS